MLTRLTKATPRQLLRIGRRLANGLILRERRFKVAMRFLAEMKTYFSGDKKPRIELLDLSVRFLAPSVAVEEGTALVTRAGEVASESSYLAIHVRENGKWQLSSVRELAPRPLPPPSHYEQLRELEWMIGEWVDDQGGTSVTMRGEWTANRNFISRSFTVMIEDRIDMSGTQVIGWDPAEKTIRSWVFDSDGGFYQGVWSRTRRSAGRSDPWACCPTVGKRRWLPLFG